MGTHLRVLNELCNEYQHDRVKMVFKSLCVILLWMKVASALEGLTLANYSQGHDPMQGWIIRKRIIVRTF